MGADGVRRSMVSPVRFLLFLLCMALAPPAAAQEPAHAIFGQHKAPSASAPASFGKYAGGCLSGGVKLAEWGGRWQAMRPHRNRNWGHPEMIMFIQRLSEAAQYAAGLVFSWATSVSRAVGR